MFSTTVLIGDTKTNTLHKYCKLNGNLLKIPNDRRLISVKYAWLLIHKRAKVPSVDYFMRGTDILALPKPCTTFYGLNSFTYTVARFWNALPDRLRAISCLNHFIRAIRQHELIG